MNKTLEQKILRVQRDELTGHFIYKKLAATEKDEHNKQVLNSIANEEMEHYLFFKQISGKEIQPNRIKIAHYLLIAKTLGVTFGVKLMEKQEIDAQRYYTEIADIVPSVDKIIEAEEQHENELINMLKEEKLNYVGSIVLGLNDALVELTGTLAGLTFALQKTSLIAVVGLITGIAASFSMAASEYLSTRAEDENENALKSAVYTGIAYILTVLVLVAPYFLISHYMVALLATIANAILIILAFNYYISIAKDLNFKRRFFEMAAISLGVAALSFGIGVLVRTFLGVDI